MPFLKNSKEINNLESLKEALRFYGERLQNTFNLDIVTIHLFDNELQQFYLPVGIGIQHTERFDVGSPDPARIAGSIVREKEVIIANDAEHHPEMSGPFTFLEGVKSAVGFPLVHEESGDIFGVIFLNKRTPHDFEKGTHEFEQIAHHVDKLSAYLYQVFNGEHGKVLTKMMRRKPTLTVAEEQATKLLEQVSSKSDALCFIFWGFNNKRNSLDYRFSIGINPDFLKQVTYSVTEDADCIIVTSFLRNKKLWDDFINENSTCLLNSQKDYGSISVIPLKHHYGQIGVLTILVKDSSSDHYKKELNRLENINIRILSIFEKQDLLNKFRILHSVGLRFLGENTELQQLLYMIVRSAHLFLNADSVAIHLYDSKKQSFKNLKNNSAIYPEEIKGFLKQPASGGLSERIIKRGRFFCEDIATSKSERVLSRSLQKHGIKAYIGTPLVHHGEPLGVMFLNFKQPTKFTPDILSFVQIFANYASLAIFGANLIIQKDLFSDIEKSIAKETDPAGVIRKILKYSKLLIPCDLIAVGEISTEGQQVNYTYTHGRERKTFHVPYNKGLSWKVIRTKEPYISNKVDEDPYFYPSDFTDIQSEMVIPLRIENEIIGILDFQSSRAGFFSEKDRDIAIELANQIALSLYKARLIEEAEKRFEQRVNDLKVFQKIYDSLDRHETLTVVLKKIIENAVQITNADYGDVWLYDDEQSCLRFAVEHKSQRMNQLPQQKRVLDMNHGGIVTRLARSWVVEPKNRDPHYLCKDTTTDPNYWQIIEDVNAEIAVPLVHDDKLIGILNIEYKNAEESLENYLVLLKVLTHQATIAIVNSRQLNRLTRLAEMSNLISKNPTISGIFENVLIKSTEIMEADYSTVEIYDPSTGKLVTRASFNLHSAPKSTGFWI